MASPQEEIRFQCPHCKKWITAAADKTGKKIDCPNPDCAGIIGVPYISQGTLKSTYFCLSLIFLILAVIVLIAMNDRFSSSLKGNEKEGNRVKITGIAAVPGKPIKLNFRSAKIKSMEGFWNVNQSAKPGPGAVLSFINTKNQRVEQGFEEYLDIYGISDLSNEIIKEIEFSLQDVETPIEGSVGFTIPDSAGTGSTATVTLHIPVAYPVYKGTWKDGEYYNPEKISYNAGTIDEEYEITIVDPDTYEKHLAKSPDSSGDKEGNNGEKGRNPLIFFAIGSFIMSAAMLYTAMKK